MQQSPKNVLFVSGAQWVPVEYFNIYYRPILLRCIADDYHFIVGAADGVDQFTQELLVKHIAGKESRTSRVTVFNKKNKDGRLTLDFMLSNGYASYPERDLAAAQQATELLCILPQFGGGQSGVMIPLLESMDEPLTASNVLEKIRQNSEPFNAELVRKVSAVYQEFYQKLCQESCQNYKK